MTNSTEVTQPEVVDAAITTDMFCTMEADDFGEWGVEKGDKLYVMGSGMARVSESDPYLFRQIFIANFMVDGHLDKVQKPFTVDATRVSPCSEEEDAMFRNIMEEDFEAPAEEGTGDEV